MKVLVVRAADDALRTAARLFSHGHEAIVSPVLEIVRIDHEIPDIDFDAVVVTSAHAFDDRLSERLVAPPLFVVGERAADAAGRAGFGRPESIALNANKLAKVFRARFPSRVRVLYLAGRDRKGELEHVLSREHDLHLVETYSAESAALSEGAGAALRGRKIDGVLHYSKRSAQIFCAQVEAASLVDCVKDLRHIAISADAAQPLLAAGWRVEIAVTPDEAAMIALLDEPA